MHRTKSTAEPPSVSSASSATNGSLLSNPALLAKTKQALRLPLSPGRRVWQLVAVKLRLWVSDADGQAIRPYYLLCLEIYPRGKVIHYTIHHTPARTPATPDFAAFLLDCVLSPAAGDPRVRPTAVAFTEEPLTRRCAELLARLGAEAQTLVLADGVGEFVGKLSRGLVERGRASAGEVAEKKGLLEVEGVSVVLMAGLMRNCVRLFQKELWNEVGENIALEVGFPEDELEGARDHGRFRKLFGTVLGKSKQVVGFALVSSLAALRDKYRRAMGMKGEPTEDESDEDKGKLGELLCAACGRRVGEVVEEDNAKYVNRCAGCKKLLYCDKVCQREDWAKRHRKECATAKNSDYVFKRDEWAWVRRELALLYVDPTSMPFDDLDAFDEYSIPFIEDHSPPLYPLAFATVIGSSIQPKRFARPNATELRMLNMTADALLEYDTSKLSKEAQHLSNGVNIRVVEDLEVWRKRSK